MKNHLTPLPFVARAARAAVAGLEGWVKTLAGRGAAAARLYHLAARLPQTGNFLPLKRPLVTDPPQQDLLVAVEQTRLTETSQGKAWPLANRSPGATNNKGKQ